MSLSRLFDRFGPAISAALMAAALTGGSVTEETVELTAAPTNDLESVAGETATLEGMAGFTLNGCWRIVGAYYLYYTKDVGDGVYVGIDPGVDEAALLGLTGIEVQLGTGDLDPEDVAIAEESALSANTPYTVSRATDVVSVTGDFSAAASMPGGEWLDRGSAHGCVGTTNLAQLADFGLDSMRFHQLDSSRLSSNGNRRIIGFKVFRGTNVTGNFRCSIHTGGAGDGDPDGATLLGELEMTPIGGSDEWSHAALTPSQIARVNSGTDRIFVGMMGDGANSAISAESVTGGGSGSHWYRDGSNQVLWIYNSPTGAGTSFPSTISGTYDSSNNFVVAIQIIWQEGPFFGDGAWRTVFGVTPGRNDTLPSTTQMTDVYVGWVGHAPPGNNLRWYRVGVYLPTHGGTQQVKVDTHETVTTLQDFTGETRHHDWGPTTGSATGWNYLEEPAGIPIVGGRLYRIAVGSTGSTPPGNLLFGFQAGPLSTATTDPVGWGGDGTNTFEFSETETIGDPNGNISPDENVVTASPLAPSVLETPPMNTGGVHGLWGHDGFGHAAA